MLYGVMAPAFFTVKAYSIRKYPEYKAWDLGIDALIFEYLCYCLMYLVQVLHVGFILEDFAWGQLVGLIYLYGKLSLTLAFAEGPGGPVNTLTSTQSLL